MSELEDSYFRTRRHREKLEAARQERPAVLDGVELSASVSDGSQADVYYTPGEILYEVRTTSSTGGQKGVKLERYDLIPAEALQELARHYGRGSEKYTDNNWRKGYEWSKSYAALMRHIQAFWMGEDMDEETGSPHLVAVAWHAFTLLTYFLGDTYDTFDDRPTGLG